MSNLYIVLFVIAKLFISIDIQQVEGSIFNSNEDKWAAFQFVSGFFGLNGERETKQVSAHGLSG